LGPNSVVSLTVPPQVLQSPWATVFNFCKPSWHRPLQPRGPGQPTWKRSQAQKSQPLLDLPRNPSRLPGSPAIWDSWPHARCWGHKGTSLASRALSTGDTENGPVMPENVPQAAPSWRNIPQVPKLDGWSARWLLLAPQLLPGDRGQCSGVLLTPGPGPRAQWKLFI
jgi:hypothetical protein